VFLLAGCLFVSVFLLFTSSLLPQVLFSFLCSQTHSFEGITSANVE